MNLICFMSQTLICVHYKYVCIVVYMHRNTSMCIFRSCTRAIYKKALCFTHAHVPTHPAYQNQLVTFLTYQSYQCIPRPDFVTPTQYGQPTIGMLTIYSILGPAVDFFSNTRLLDGKGAHSSVNWENKRRFQDAVMHVHVLMPTAFAA